MRIPRSLATNSLPFLLAAIAILALLPACSINVKKNQEGEDKKVDIETPIGGIHVSENADVRDTGLPVYPGAKEKQKDNSNDSKQANVNISGPGFGLKVVAIEYTSDDPPQKLLDFYRDQLKKYGNVLECHTDKHSGDISTDIGKKKDSHELSCEGDHGKNVELKAGTRENQHIVAIEPKDKGSDFALVYVHAHGKGDMI
jgi:hypothetical protein